MKIQIKRAYAEPDESDGKRILVDRLWPRGVSKERARIDLWLKEVAPSAELRKWFGHDPAKWEEFRERYLEELRGSDALRELGQLAAHERVTLVFGAKNEENNQAVVLRELLGEQ